MRVIGIDPGLTKTGVGVIDAVGNRMVPVFFETVTMKKSFSRHEKLKQIFDQISRVITEFHPQVMSLEDVFFSKNFKAAIRLGEARSAAILAGTFSGITVCEYLPTRVKMAICGNGRAAKQQVQHMISQILGLKEIPEEDAADALAIAVCHAQTNQFQARLRQ